MTLLDRFMSQVSPCPNTGCWWWTGSASKHPYGRLAARILVGRSNQKAYRVAWELFRGPIPVGDGYHGVCVCHRCDNGLCVNPEHLFLGTQRDNMLDAARKRRPQCRLDEVSIAPIIFTYRAGVSAQQLGRWFGVGRKTIMRVVRREHYAHVNIAA